MPATYLPPSMRNRVVVAQQTSAQKTAPKKKVAVEVVINDVNAFPSLNDTMKTNNKKSGTPISFSSALSKKTEVAKIEEKNELKPGWVYIRKHNGVIQTRYGAPVLFENREEQESIKLGNILFKYRIAREQYERDMDVERLGDLSEYYGEPTLDEIYENDVENKREEYESSDYDSSDNIN